MENEPIPVSERLAPLGIAAFIGVTALIFPWYSHLLIQSVAIESLLIVVLGFTHINPKISFSKKNLTAVAGAVTAPIDDPVEGIVSTNKGYEPIPLSEEMKRKIEKATAQPAEKIEPIQNLSEVMRPGLLENDIKRQLNLNAEMKKQLITNDQRTQLESDLARSLEMQRKTKKLLSSDHVDLGEQKLIPLSFNQFKVVHEWMGKLKNAGVINSEIKELPFSEEDKRKLWTESLPKPDLWRPEGFPGSLLVEDGVTKRYFTWRGKDPIHNITQEELPRQLLKFFISVCDEIRRKTAMEPAFNLADDIKGEVVYEISMDSKAKWKLLGGMNGAPANQVLIVNPKLR